MRGLNYLVEELPDVLAIVDVEGERAPIGAAAADGLGADRRIQTAAAARDP